MPLEQPSGQLLDRLDELLDRAARAYLEFAACRAPGTGAGDASYDGARAAWEDFVGTVADSVDALTERDLEAAGWLAQHARTALERFAARVTAGAPGPELHESAVRAVLGSELSSRAAGADPHPFLDMTALEFLRALPRRPYGLMAAFARSRRERFLAIDLARRSSWDEPEDLVVRIEVLLADGLHEEAEAALGQLRHRAPGSTHRPRLEAECLRCRAGELRRRGDLAGALALLRSALGKRPDDGSLALDLGVALREGGRPAESLAHIASAFETRPQVLVELGRSRLHMLDVEAARAFFSSALRDPRSEPGARVGLAEADRLLGFAARAVDALRAVPPRRGEDVTAALVHAAALLDLGRHAEALRLLRTLIDLGFARPHVLALLSRGLRLSGSLLDAGDAAGLALTEPGSIFPALVEAALAEIACGREPQADEWVNRHAPRLLQPQEHFYLTTYRGADAGATLHFVHRLVAGLRELGVPLANAADAESDRIWFHLEADLGSPLRAEEDGPVAAAPRPGKETP